MVNNITIILVIHNSNEEIIQQVEDILKVEENIQLKSI